MDDDFSMQDIKSISVTLKDGEKILYKGNGIKKFCRKFSGTSKIIPATKTRGYATNTFDYTVGESVEDMMKQAASHGKLQF